MSLRIASHAHGHSSALISLRDFHLAILCFAFLALAPVSDALGLDPNAGTLTSGHFGIYQSGAEELLSPPCSNGETKQVESRFELDKL
jgi:hypothetical protein